MRLGRWAFLAIAGGTSGIASAAETITYSYDALGRLITTTKAGGPRAGKTNAQRYDPAGNRNARVSGQTLPVEATAVTFSLIGPGSVARGSRAVFQVSKTGPAAAVVTLSFATANGSATSPADYAAASGVLSFRSWETLKTLPILTTDDGLASPAKQFSVTISAPSAGGSIATGNAQATIAASLGTAPVTNPDELTVGTCSGNSANVVANDSDPYGGYPLVLVSVGGSIFGQVTITSPTTIRYNAFGTPGSDTIIYTVKNTAGKTATGILNVAIVDQGGCN
jgi:YD repeat-containing protein